MFDSIHSQQFLGIAAGHKIVLVSSGAVGVGCLQLGLEHRPTELARRQALAAAGQIHLMRYYDDFFSAVGVVSSKKGPEQSCSSSKQLPYQEILLKRED